MPSDRFFTIAFSPATIAFVAFIFSLVVDVRTWKRLGELPNGQALQMTTGVATGFFAVAGLIGILLTSVEIENHDFRTASFFPLSIVAFLCIKLATLSHLGVQRSPQSVDRSANSRVQ